MKKIRGSSEGMRSLAKRKVARTRRLKRLFFWDGDRFVRKLPALEDRYPKREDEAPKYNMPSLLEKGIK